MASLDELLDKMVEKERMLTRRKWSCRRRRRRRRRRQKDI